MFKNLASDIIGTSDIGKILSPSEFNKADVDDYVFHEDNEEIFFLIKSKTDEYCFTNLAFIHLDGESAMSKRRKLTRYEYQYNHFGLVQLETAGTVDLDVEIKFELEDREFSIDVDKKQIEKLKDLYKTLIAISYYQKNGTIKSEQMYESIAVAEKVLGRYGKDESVVSSYESIRNSNYHFLQEEHKINHKKDFGDLFRKYIEN